MDWHLVARVGNAIPPATRKGSERVEFFVGTPVPSGTTPDRVVARNVLATLGSAGHAPDQLAVDLFRFAVAAFVADQRVPRGGNHDGWTRPLVLSVPVPDLGPWAEASPLLSAFLRFLTGDAWNVAPYESEAARVNASGAPSDADGPSGVCLLSGGLDSFLGATSALASGERWSLVSHQAIGSANHQSPAQDRVFQALAGEFEDGQAERLAFEVSRLKMPKGQKVEGTQRSRSAVFLALGTLVASSIRRDGVPTPLLIPENGFVSLNVPLTYARLGSPSTRTTHPHTLALYQSVLDSLGLAVGVRNPFALRTKGEMLVESPRAAFARAHARDTVSCANAGNTYRFHGKDHCGYCVPCLVRRGALRAGGIDNPSRYYVDVTCDAIKRGSVVDNNLKAFGMALARTADGSAGVEVLKPGPLPDPVDGYADVYVRGLREVADLLPSG